MLTAQTRRLDESLSRISLWS